MEIFLDPSTWFSLMMLTFMEIVLGIDNVIFISIVAGRLPKHQQKTARYYGLIGALFIRIGLLFCIKWIASLTFDVFSLAFINDLLHIHAIADPGISLRDLILIAGGLFLLGKSVSEMHQKLQGEEEIAHKEKSGNAFFKVLFQIVLLDVVFSFDSILTAIGLVDSSKILIMILAIIISMIVMMLFSTPVSEYINRRPTIKMLALSFLVLIGFMLVMEGLGEHVNKGYIYFAIIYAFGVELLNLRMRRKTEPIQLREAIISEEEANEKK